MPTRLLLFLTFAVCLRAANARPTVGLFSDPLVPPAILANVNVLERTLQQRGLTVQRIDSTALADANRFNRRNFDLLVYAAGTRYPADAAANILAYVKDGGHLIVLGGPAFSEPAWNVDGTWQTRAMLRRAMGRTAPEQLLFSFDQPTDLNGWRHSSNDPKSPSSVSAVEAGSGHGQSLQVDIGNLTGWDTWNHDVGGLPDGDQLFCFWAKDDGKTGQIAVELAERDGSRWIATVPISAQWDYYALTPDQFHYYQDNPSHNRGGEGDRVHFANVRLLSVGLAFSHTPVSAGAHRFWIDEVGMRRDPHVATSQAAPELVLDGLAPAYKCFPVTQAVAIRSYAGQAFLPVQPYTVPRDLFSVSPRPQGTGFGKDRYTRFVPLINAYDRQGRRNGYVAWMYLNGSLTGVMGLWRGSGWAAFGVNDAAWYRQPAVQSTIGRLAVALTAQPYLYEGGAQYYTYFAADRSVQLGARVVVPNAAIGSTEPAATVRISVRRAGDGKSEYTHTWNIARRIEPDDAQWPDATAWRGSVAWTPSATEWQHGSFTVRTELYQGKQLVDSLTHPLTVWRPRPPAQRHYVTVRDGDFWLDGHRWAAHGVNYMPSSGIGLEEVQNFEFWLFSPAYDPAVIDEDLARIAGLGMNMISVFIYNHEPSSRNLLDLLMRAEKYHLKVNLGLRPNADPFDYHADAVRTLITEHDLPESDVVFAYDLAWERTFGTYEPNYGNVRGRKAYDTQWKAWVIDHYGTIENAEADWGVPINQRDGEVTSPPDSDFGADGPWRKLAAAYRRFADDFTSRNYGRVARDIRTIDPHHLISFRMNSAGDPTAGPQEFCFDFKSLGRALDIMEPEGYGRTGVWEHVRPGAFTETYSRYAAPGRPLMWAEFGQSTWGQSNFTPGNPAKAAAGQFYDNFYRMLALSHANGSVAWWFPGGFRWTERSDFGIINADGSDRPVTTAIKRWMPTLKRVGEQPRPPVDTWIEVDRDADARGLFGIYDKVQAQYWQALAQGKVPGLRDAGSGTTSADTPLLAVGAVPYNGKNPPKYLNAEFDRLEIRDVSGHWVNAVPDPLAGGTATVEVAAGKPVMARATVGNTEVATWLAAPNAARDGAVYLATPADSPLQLAAPAPIAAATLYLGTATVKPFVLTSAIDHETSVVLQMTAWGRMWFGDKVRVLLRPVAR